MAKLLSTDKIKRLVVKTQKGQVYIFYGSDPYSHSPFEAAAWYLRKRLTEIYKNTQVKVNPLQNIQSSGKALQFLLESRNKEEDKIRELHFFSHSWGTGLSLYYGGTPSSQDIKDLENLYGKLVTQHIGSDDYDKFNPNQLRISNFQYLSEDKIKKLQSSFSPGAIVRLWGCNTGFGNSNNSPYANIAKTFAQYANLTAFGSSKGTNFYAFIDGKWTTKFPPVGQKAPWPFELRPYRSDKANQANKFTPTESISKLVKKQLKPKTPKVLYKVLYIDAEMNPIAPDPANAEVYKLKAGSYSYFEFEDFEFSEKQISLYNITGPQILFDKMMDIPAHSEWALSSDKKVVKLKSERSGFSGNIHNINVLTENGLIGKEYYFKANYSGVDGAKVFEGKKQRFTLT